MFLGWERSIIILVVLYYQDGRLFEVGANSRLGAYSNKYGTRFLPVHRCGLLIKEKKT